MNVKKKKMALILLITTLSQIRKRQQKRKQRRWWVKPWLNLKYGNINIINQFIKSQDNRNYKNFLRMDEHAFQKLLNLIKPKIEKSDTKLRQCISAENKLIITLRYLATGESFRSLMYNFRVSESTISLFVPVVCSAIYNELKSTYLKVPSTTENWLCISREFEEIWNLPNILGAIDGKHIVIKAQGDQGSAFYNYKKQHSIVLLAMVDANYNFTYINVGINGRISDGGVFRESDLSTAIQKNQLNFPEDRPLPLREKPVPFVIAADAAFPLSTNIIKPYPMRGLTKEQRIFNYRLSRVRRVVENTFGILSNRFRVLLNTSALNPEKTKIVTQACCALHNFLRKELNTQYTGSNPESQIDGRFTFMYGLNPQNIDRPKNVALSIREEFKEYVNGVGSVPWQEETI